jgi:hypothetical protein
MLLNVVQRDRNFAGEVEHAAAGTR